MAEIVRTAVTERDRLYEEIERGVRALAARGLTQRQIAAETGISQPTVSRMLSRS
jgi:DNA-binding transcriptional regulator LsrR (DeoR family)